MKQTAGFMIGSLCGVLFSFGWFGLDGAAAQSTCVDKARAVMDALWPLSRKFIGDTSVLYFQDSVTVSVHFANSSEVKAEGATLDEAIGKLVQQSSNQSSNLANALGPFTSQP